MYYVGWIFAFHFVGLIVLLLPLFGLMLLLWRWRVLYTIWSKQAGRQATSQPTTIVRHYSQIKIIAMKEQQRPKHIKQQYDAIILPGPILLLFSMHCDGSFSGSEFVAPSKCSWCKRRIWVQGVHVKIKDLASIDRPTDRQQTAHNVEYSARECFGWSMANEIKTKAACSREKDRYPCSHSTLTKWAK